MTAPRARLGINLSSPVDWSTEFPFADRFRMARAWISQREGAPWGKGPALDLDARGNVRRLESGCHAETLLYTIDGGRYPSGEYRFTWLGRGTVVVSGAATAVRTAPGRIDAHVDSAKGAIFIQIRATAPSDPIRSLRCVRVGETPGPGGFRREFLDRWRGMAAVRFMDWQHTNGSPLAHWSDRPRVADCAWGDRGVPLETCIDLANALEADPWICIPHQADDEFVRRTGALVRERLAPGLRVWLEYSNELWNGGFSQTTFAEARGIERRLHDKPWEAGWRWSALRSVEVFDRFEEGFRNRARTVRVMATQAANAYIAGVKLGFRDAGKHCDALAIAPYDTFNIEPSRAAAVVRGGVDGVLDHLAGPGLEECTRWMRDHRTVARTAGVRLVAYEAGQHAVGIAGAESDDALTKVLTAANRHPRLGRIYSHYLDRWRDVAGGDLCCLYASMGVFGRYGSFGLLEHELDRTPKHDAVRAWMRANPAR
ncbi:MAG: hypothetical protein ACKO5K_04300 [Armatimonadota bacterium]